VIQQHGRGVKSEGREYTGHRRRAAAIPFKPLANGNPGNQGKAALPEEAETKKDEDDAGHGHDHSEWTAC
jgi:hypothetical protein